MLDDGRVLDVPTSADRRAQVYLVALDQLLAVATGPKIGNSLNSLNISWIATS